MNQNLPVLVLNGTILIPQSEIKLEFDDETSKNIIAESEFFHDKRMLVVTKISNDENLNVRELPKVGTVVKIIRKLQLPNGKFRVVLKGIERALVYQYLCTQDNTVESIIKLVKPQYISEEIQTGLIRKLYSELNNYIDKVPSASNSFLSTLSDNNDINIITDIIVNNISLEKHRKLEYLSEIDVLKRVEMLLQDIYKEEQLYNIEQNIDTKVKKELDKDQKDFYLKEKIKKIKDEIGDLSLKDKEVEELRQKTSELNCREIIKSKILNEIDRYDNMPSMSIEIGGLRNYIYYMLALPWEKSTDDEKNFNLIKEKLNKNHFGLTEIKDRIIEYLVVKSKSISVDTPILCLIGPPGVGKTTIASSIADSIGRKFIKVSLGGVDDYAYIKGHTRAYIGSTPGKIIDGVMRSGSNNPVFLLDEIDKLSCNYKGDPSSALLEVLDPIQNKYFKDNYVDEEFDLSNVLFIATANSYDDIPPILRDRLEIIYINGYTQLEKLSIAKEYLIPVICKKHDIKSIKISDKNIVKIIKYYTKESGLRELYRMISKIVRKIVTDKIYHNKKSSLTISNIEKFLGNRLYEIDEISNYVGIVNGLACNSEGGTIVKIESSIYDGSGKLTVTGTVGDMFIDSCKVVLGYLKANKTLLNLKFDFNKKDIHINVLDLSIRKEGPSAGIAVISSLISTILNINIPSNIAMTGEVSLNGNVLKVGGIKEKIIGAYINNIDTVFIPFANLEIVENLPIEIIEKIKFIGVKNYKEVLSYLKEINNM